MTIESPDPDEGTSVQPAAQPSPAPRKATVESIRAALRRAAPGADELNEDLRAAFELSDSSATLRLR